MNNSRIKWLGFIPETWDLKRVKDIFNVSRGRVIPLTDLKDDGMYPVYSSQTENNGCMGYIDSFDYDGTCLTWTTDGVYAGTVFLRIGKFNCTNICGILQPRSDIYMPYAYYCLSTATPHHKRLDTNGAKIMSNEMATIMLPIPDSDTQKKIADYLDEKTTAIDTQISLLEQKAKKYEQLKKALISHAVTRGLSKDVRLKESGIDWIGQIPEHWSIVEIKHYCRSIFAGATPSTKEASFWDGDIPWLPSGACHDGIITEFNHTITEEGFVNSSTKMIPANTTLMAMTGATCANTGYLTFESCANQSVCAYIENKKTCNSKYLFYLLQAARKYILTFQTGGAQAGINLQDCSLLEVPCVPLSEQQTIADYLDKKTAEIDAAIANINQQIEKYKLLRRALINEVVTGQRAI